ncbi:MAG: hypothetical protein QW838_02900 [Candidatus Nitrosotenuis sp.]
MTSEHEPSDVCRQLKMLCAHLTSSFETGYSRDFLKKCGTVAGNFDGSVASVGILQFSFYGILPKLLKLSYERRPEEFERIFGPRHMTKLRMLFKGASPRIFFDRPGHTDVDFLNKLREWSCQNVDLQLEEGIRYYWAIMLRDLRDLVSFSICRPLGKWAAFCFDVAVQNGGLRSSVKEELRQTPPEGETEEERMRGVLERRLLYVNPRWQADVRARKMTIIHEEGIVHGTRYVLKTMFPQWEALSQRDFSRELMKEDVCV